MSRARGQIDYINRKRVIGRLNHEFVQFDPTYLEQKRAAAGTLKSLSDELLAIQESDGLPLFRSARILDEATWASPLHGRLAKAAAADGGPPVQP